MEGQQKNVNAISGMVLGIISLIFNFYGIIGILAIILSALGLKKAKELNSGKGMAIAGLVLGIIATVWFFLVLILGATLLSAL